VIKLTVKREKFAMRYVQKGSAVEAYRFAFNVRPNTKAESIRVEANKLVRDPQIAARIQELREKARKLHDLKVEDIMAELDENRELALKVKQPSAATQATMGKAKVGGFLIDKMQVDVTLRGLAERMRARKNGPKESTP